MKKYMNRLFVALVAALQDALKKLFQPIWLLQIR